MTEGCPFREGGQGGPLLGGHTERGKKAHCWASPGRSPAGRTECPWRLGAGRVETED